MADDNKLSGKVGLDTTDFKTNVAGLNRELRVVESGFRASAAALGDWANDADGLEMRIDALNKSIDIQGKKVAATRAEYERIKTEKGETSRAAQDLQIKLNKETETLNKMQGELGSTNTSLEQMRSDSKGAGDAVEKSGNQANESGNKFQNFSNLVQAAGKGIAAVIKTTITVVAGLAVAVAGVGASIGALVLKSAEAGSEIQDMSDKTGISAQRLQELHFIGDQVGTDLDTITGAQARLIRSMSEASDQSQTYAQKLDEARKAGKDLSQIDLGPAANAFKELGVSVTDSGGNLRSNQDVFNETIDRLGRIQNPAERDALAMQIFGKSAQELNPLIKLGSAGMADLTKQAHEMGAVMSDETVASLDNFDDSLTAIKDGLKGTLGTLAAAFLPGFQAILNQGGGYLKQFAQIVSGSNGDLGKMAKGIGGLISQIATDVAKQAPQLLQAGLTIVKSILDAIISALPQMLTAATEILNSLVNFLIQALPQLLQAGVQILLMLVNAIIQNLPMLVNAALQAIIALANGLAQALPNLIPAVVQAIITIVTTLTNNIPLLINAALQLINGLALGLVQALPILIAALPQIIDAILNALISSLPQIAVMAGRIVGTLATGIIAAIPVLLVAVGNLIVRLGNTLANFIRTLPDLGRKFVQGLAEGVKNAAGLLYDAVKNLVNNMIAQMKALLGISSPSKVGIGFGENFFGAVGLGGTRAAPTVIKQMLGAAQQMIRDLNSSLAQDANAIQFNMGGAMRGFGSPAFAGAAAAGGDSIENNNFQLFAPVVIQGSTPAGSLGARLKGRRY